MVAIFALSLELDGRQPDFKNCHDRQRLLRDGPTVRQIVDPLHRSCKTILKAAGHAGTVPIRFSIP